MKNFISPFESNIDTGSSHSAFAEAAPQQLGQVACVRDIRSSWSAENVKYFQDQEMKMPCQVNTAQSAAGDFAAVQ